MHFSQRFSPELVRAGVAAALPPALLPKVLLAVGDLVPAVEVPFTHTLTPEAACEAAAAAEGEGSEVTSALPVSSV